MYLQTHTCIILFCSSSGVEDIVRYHPDSKDIVRPSDNVTALHLASVRDKLDVVTHLALSVSIILYFNLHLCFMLTSTKTDIIYKCIQCM